MKISSLTLAFDDMTWKSIGNKFSHWDFTISIMATFKAKKSKEIETAFDSSMTLILWPWELNINRGHLFSRGINCTQVWQPDQVTWTSVTVIYSQEASSVQSLATFQQRGEKILSGQHFYIDKQFDFDLWPCDLKSIRFIYSL